MENYLIIGADLFDAVFAREAANRGNKVAITERRNHIAGNIYTKKVDEIQVYQYGAHVFHTSNKKVWNYVHQFAKFNRYTNCPVASYEGHMYNLPFSMDTLGEIRGVKTPQKAMGKINGQRQEVTGKEPRNLEEQAILLIDGDTYEELIKGYTEKQWDGKATELPAFIIKRLPVRLTCDDNYFNDDYQGIPIDGYTKMVGKIIDHPNITVELNTDFFDKKEEYLNNLDKVIYTDMIDKFFDYKLGELEYRSLRFETEEKNVGNYQGSVVINYTGAEIPYTRVIEHRHLEFNRGNENKTIITHEYPVDWKRGDEPYYPVSNDRNNDLYKQYAELAGKQDKVTFDGRLGQYKYYNMDQAIAATLEAVKNEFEE